MRSAVVIGTLALGCGGLPPTGGANASSGGTTPIAAPAPKPDADDKPKSIWSACYADFKPTGRPDADLQRLTTLCGTTGGMHPLTPTTMGEQAEKQPVDRYQFLVPKAGGCYRVYAVGDRGVSDLDLLIRDSAGQILGGDLTHDAWPIVPPDGALCVDQPGLYMLEVSVFRGSGHYAVQIWGK